MEPTSMTTDFPDYSDEPVYIQVLSYSGVVLARVPKSGVKTLFQRALNTWSDAPKELIEFSDSLEKM